MPTPHGWGHPSTTSTSSGQASSGNHHGGIAPTNPIKLILTDDYPSLSLSLSKMATFGTQHLHSLLTELPVRWRGTLIVAIPVTCLLIAVGSFAVLQRSAEADQRYLTHSQEKLLQANRLLKTLVDAETGVRGYGLSREPSFLEPYNSALKLLPDTVKKLSSLVQDNPQQGQQVRQIQALVLQELSFLKQDLQAFKIATAKGVSSQSPDLLVKGKATLDTIRGLVADFSAQEQLRLKQHNQQLSAY